MRTRMTGLLAAGVAAVALMAMPALATDAGTRSGTAPGAGSGSMGSGSMGSGAQEGSGAEQGSGARQEDDTVGSSGARLVATLAGIMAENPKARVGLTALCIGVGQGIATLWDKS